MNRQQGFSLTFVIVALMMVGTAVYVLTAASNTMLFHADSDYLQAGRSQSDCQRPGLGTCEGLPAAGTCQRSAVRHELDTAGFSCPTRS